jgi:hypothetical protein
VPSDKITAVRPLSCSPFTSLLLSRGVTSLLFSRSALSALCQIRARIPWQSGNLALAQSKRRFYRPNGHHLAMWQTGVQAPAPLSPYHFITLSPLSSACPP